MSGTPSKNSNGKPKPSFLAFVQDEKDREVLKTFANGHQWADAAIHTGDIKTAAEYLKSNPSPLLLVVEIPSAAEAPALLDALADVCDPDTKVITIGAINEYSFYCWLMELGIFSYLLKPLTQQMLENAYQKSVEPAPVVAAGSKPPGKIIAVTGARGGVGATTVALNLAGIIADLSGNPVALVDTDSQAGSIALALDIEPSRGFRDVLEKPDRIDSLFIDRVMIKPSAHLSVLSSEESLHEQVQIHEDAASALLRELRSKFDVVVLDISRHITPFGKQCMRHADHVVLVTEMTLVSLRDVLRLGDLLRESLKLKPAIIVANRVGAAGKQEVKSDDFEKGINDKIAHSIAFEPDIWMQVGTEVTAVKHKTDAAVRPLYALAEQLIPEMKGKMAEESTKKFALPGLFKPKKKE